MLCWWWCNILKWHFSFSWLVYRQIYFKVKFSWKMWPFSAVAIISGRSQLLAVHLMIFLHSWQRAFWKTNLVSQILNIVCRSLAASWFDSALNPWSSRSGLSLGQEHCNFVFLDKILGSKWKKKTTSSDIIVSLTATEAVHEKKPYISTSKSNPSQQFKTLCVDVLVHELLITLKLWESAPGKQYFGVTFDLGASWNFNIFQVHCYFGFKESYFAFLLSGADCLFFNVRLGYTSLKQKPEIHLCSQVM